MGCKTLVYHNQFFSDAAMADWLDKRAESLGIGKAALLRAIVRMCMDKWPEEGVAPAGQVKEEDLYGRIGFALDAGMFSKLSDLAKQRGGISLGAVAKELVRAQLGLKKPGRGVALVEATDVLEGRKI